MIDYSINRTLGGSCHLCIYSNDNADFFRAVRIHDHGFEIELLQKNGKRVFQSYPDDGEKAIDNAASMLDGIIEEANSSKESEPLLIATAGEQKKAVLAFRKEAKDE